MNVKHMVLATTSAFVAIAAATPAAAVVTVYTSQAAFLAASQGIQSYGIPGMPSPTEPVVSPYTPTGVTVTDRELVKVNDGNFGGQTYLAGGYGVNTVVSTAASALGLTLGSAFGNRTVPYTVTGGITGSIVVGQTASFLGFINSNGPLSITFRPASELDIIGFQVGAAAVPEPMTWAMMLAGFGIAGMAMRRRRTSVRVRFA